MSYANPHRDALRDDDARYHWDSHVLIDTGLHRTAREARAAAEGRSYDEQLDVEFAMWHTEKKLTGFANFDTSPLGTD